MKFLCRGCGTTDRSFKSTALAALLGLLALAAPARAVLPDEMLQDPGLEARARDISQELRCVVCQNQTIDDSNAPLARDLRILVRERLTAGDSNEQAKAFIVARYGNFVLLRPPMQTDTLALWFGPAIFLLIAGIGFGRYLLTNPGKAAPEAATSLSPDEEKRLDALLNAGKPT